MQYFKNILEIDYVYCLFPGSQNASFVSCILEESIDLCSFSMVLGMKNIFLKPVKKCSKY